MSYDRQHAKKIIKHIINDMAALFQAGTPLHELPQDRKKEVVKGWVDYAEEVIKARITGEPGDYLKAYFDGSATPNPGLMSLGWSINDSMGNTIKSRSKNLPHGTNNKAEYLALIDLLKELKRFPDVRVRIHGDSQLVVNQVKGEWNCKAKYLQPLCNQAQQLMKSNYELVWVPRGQNTEADQLSKRK